jgi:type II secretory pathway pseudopilin PulG
MRRIRQENGFGLLELIISIVILNVGILAVVGAFNSGILAIGRASRTATAMTIADQQMELYSGITYSNIEQDTCDWNTATADTTYTSDSAYQTINGLPSGQRISTVGAASPCTGTKGCPNASVNSCNPSFTVTGPDNHSYRVDTYMYYSAVPSGSTDSTPTKVVTVVVRNAADLSHSLTRETSTFDALAGS